MPTQELQVTTALNSSKVPEGLLQQTHAGFEGGRGIVGSESFATKLQRAAKPPGWIIIFFHSFASAESAVLRAVVSLVTPLARVRR